MKIQELRDLSAEELVARVRELKQQAMHLRIQKATGQLENKGAIRAIRKDIARVLTLLTERRRTAPAAAAPAPAPARRKPAAKAKAK